MSRLPLGGDPDDGALDPDNLREISEMWGTQFADTMISNPEWPKSDHARTILAARKIVARAIRDIVATLHEGEDFRPHLPMMASSIRAAFESSLPGA